MSRTSFSRPPEADRARFHRAAAWITLGGLVAALAWDASGLDLPWARAFGGPGGFPLRENWLLTDLLHDAGRRAAWLAATALVLGVWWPFGPLRRLAFPRRQQLAVSVLAASAAVAALKAFSATSCPWDLHAFGGVAHWEPHWLGWAHADGGSGHCFPAGHASSGFAFLAGWFAFRDWPALARRWTAAAASAGLVLGLAQQARGAHFMSHTLWTAWVCWTVAWGIDLAASAFGRGAA